MLVHLQPVGDRGMYYMNVVGGATDPGFGRPEGGRPDNTLPGGRPGGRPDNTLPGMGGNRPDNTLPGQGGRPDNTLPGGGGIPDHELPDTPPPNLAPGYTLVLVRHDGRWQYAAIAPGSPPPRPLPPQGRPDRPDQGLPGAPPRPDQGLPPGAQPKPAE